MHDGRELRTVTIRTRVALALRGTLAALTVVLLGAGCAIQTREQVRDTLRAHRRAGEAYDAVPGTDSITAVAMQRAADMARLDSFARGPSPPELTVTAAPFARSGAPAIRFNGTLRDPDMVAVAQFRLARQQDTTWVPASGWMALVLAGGRWTEATGRYTGTSMQHMRLAPGTYRVIVRAEDTRGSIVQAVSGPVALR